MSIKAIAISMTLLSVILPGESLIAATLSFNSQPLWQESVGGIDAATVLHFDNGDVTGLRNVTVDQAPATPFYQNQGVNFLPFLGTTIYPIIFLGQDYQIQTPGRDGLLANNNSPNQTSNLAGRAIRFDFNQAFNAVGTFTNNIDRGTLEAYDVNLNSLGSIGVGQDGRGGFGGLITDVPIHRVVITNTYDGDIQFGIYDLQFASTLSSVPLPGSIWLLASALAGIGLVSRRRKVAS